MESGTRGVAIHAYTAEEWGLGGSHPSGGNYRARTFTGLCAATVIMTVPAILAPFGVLLGVVGLFTSVEAPKDVALWLIVIVGSLLCTALFTLGWLLAVKSLRQEWRARKLRKTRGLPKPLFGVTDDQARRYFEQHPGSLEIIRENFPGSTRPFPGEDHAQPS